MSLASLLRTAAAGTAARLAAYLETRFAALEAGSSGLQLASTAPADVTKAAAAVGNGTTAARANHKHDISTAAPSDVTKSAAAEGTATSLARSDHKHDVSTAAAGGLTSASTSAEGSATSLARSDHAHAITALNGSSISTVAEKSAGVLSAAGIDFGIPQVLILDVPAGATGNIDFTAAPFKFRVIDIVARKVTTSADAGDTGQLQTGAGTAIGDVVALNIAAGVLARALSIDPTTHEIAAAGTLRWRRTQLTNAACKVHVTVVRVA